MNYIIISIATIASISIIINILMVGYAKNTLLKIETVYTAADETAEIFSMIDSYKEHINSVYEMPTFYGDETLKGLLDHSSQMIEFLKRYENIYSMTQPNLEEQLLEASRDINNDEAAEEKE